MRGSTQLANPTAKREAPALARLGIPDHLGPSSRRTRRQAGKVSVSLLVIALLASGWTAPLWAAPEETAAVASAVDPSKAENAEEQQLPVVQDEVFVEGLLPAVPTANTVAAKLPLSLQLTPGSVGVVESDVIAEQKGFVLGDALKNISGLNVQTGSGVFDFFVVRGLDSVSSGLILTDGAPEPETTFYQLYNVERVEVLKGPSAFLYGGSPLGGTVNLVRKQPLRNNQGRLGASVGSFNTAESTLDLNWTAPSKRVSFRLNSLFQQSDNYRDDKDSENLAINPALTFRPSDRTSVNFNFEWVEAQYQSDAGLPLLGQEIPEVPRRRSYQSPFDGSDQDIYRLQVDFEQRRSAALTLRNKTYYRQMDWRSDGTIFNGVFPHPLGDFIVSRTLLSLDDTQDFLGDQFEVLWQRETGVWTHNLLFGMEFARLADDFTLTPRLLPEIALFNPVETAGGPTISLPGPAADARSEVAAPYVVDQIAFSEKVQFLLGLRFDRIDFSDDVTQSSRTDEELSPMLGITFTPKPELAFYANAGRAFAAPSTLVVGQERVPEESQQVEVGIKKLARGGKVRTTLALYQIDRENIAIPDDNGITQQTGDQRSRGLELEISADLGRGLRAFGSYAYTDAELTEFREAVLVNFFPPTFAVLDRSGNTPAFAPEHLANLWVSQHTARGLGWGGGLRYVGSQFIAEDNAFEIADVLTVDAALFWQRGPWQFNLNLKNLSNEEYFTRGFGNTSVIPAPGFSAIAGVHYSFSFAQ